MFNYLKEYIKENVKIITVLFLCIIIGLVVGLVAYKFISTDEKTELININYNNVEIKNIELKFN